MPHLHRLHETYRERGFAVLGLNCADSPDIARELLREKGAAFPTIVDSSEAAAKTVFQDYRAMAVPTHYMIDRDGKIADAWCDHDEPRLRRALETLAVTAKAGG